MYRPGERRTEIVVLLLDLDKPRLLARTADTRDAILGKLEVMNKALAVDIVRLACFRQPLEAVPAHRLQQPIERGILVELHERLIHESRHIVEHVLSGNGRVSMRVRLDLHADGLSGLEREGAREDAEAAHAPTFPVSEQAVTPVEGRV